MKSRIFDKIHSKDYIYSCLHQDFPPSVHQFLYSNHHCSITVIGNS